MLQQKALELHEPGVLAQRHGQHVVVLGQLDAGRAQPQVVEQPLVGGDGAGCVVELLDRDRAGLGLALEQAARLGAALERDVDAVEVVGQRRPRCADEQPRL